MNQKLLKFNSHIIKINYRNDSDLSVIDEIFVDRMYRSTESIIPNLRSPILDIGAHIGLFSIYASALNPQVKIIALEPEPENFKLMKENLKLNHCKNVTAVQHAVILSESEGRVERSPRTTTLYLNANSHNHSTFYKTTNPIDVPAITLENLITKNKLDKIGLLKMDIEGAEFDIFKNIDQDTWSKIQYIAVEYHELGNNKRADLENIIRSHGFSVEHFPNHFDNRFGLLVCRNKKI